MTIQRELFERALRFRCFQMDPPWMERGGGKIKRGADRHYPLVHTKEMPRIIRSSGFFEPEEHAHLWLWTTDNFLPDALWLMRELGFRYVRTMVWIKMPDPGEVIARLLSLTSSAALVDVLEELGKSMRPARGIGQYLRGSHELCLFGVRGKGKDPSVRTEHRDVSSVVFGARGRHSEKPASAYAAIERVSHGPRVEFFARSQRPGWTSWGNEVSPQGGEE